MRVHYLSLLILIGCIACSKEDTGITEVSPEVSSPENHMSWQEFKGLSLKEKLEFDKWVADTIYYEEYKLYANLSGWHNVGTFSAQPLPSMQHIYFEDYLAFQCTDSAHFSFFRNVNGTSSINLNGSQDALEYYFSLGALGDSLTASLSLIHDSTLVMKAYGSSSFHSEKVSGGEPHYKKRNYTFIYQLEGSRINSATVL